MWREYTHLLYTRAPTATAARSSCALRAAGPSSNLHSPSLLVMSADSCYLMQWTGSASNRPWHCTWGWSRDTGACRQSTGA